MRLGVLLVAGVLAALPVLEAGSPAFALTNADKIRIVEAEKRSPPIQFFVAKGAPDSCGAGCDQWIAADGHIDADAAERLRQLFQKIGKAKLPIYFNSPGGDLHQAMAIGRMLRARGMTAGVARTLSAKCLPIRSVEECTAAFRAHPDSEAVLWTDNARCLSACPIAVIGATTRQIAPNALLGVHSTFVYFAHPPRGATQAQLDRALERGTQRLENTFASYVAEMKLSKELFRLIWNTRFEDMHYLTRAELFDLGIDRREPVETGWHFGYQPIPAVGSAAFLNLQGKSEGAAGEKKRMTLIISCDSRYLGSFLLTSLRGIPNSSSRPSRDLRLSAGASVVTLTSSGSFLTSYNNETFEVRQQRTPRAVAETLMKASAITVAEQALPSERDQPRSSEASTAQVETPGTGGADALRILVAHCAQPLGVAARVAVLVPASIENAFLNVGDARDAAWRFGFLPVGSIGSAAFANAPWTRSQMLLAISCGGLGSYTISVVQRLASTSATPKSDFQIGEESLGISLPLTAVSLKMWKGDSYALRQSKWPRSVVEKLLAPPTITVKERVPIAAASPEPIKADGARPDQYSMPTKGAQDALKALSDHCAMLN